MRLAPAAVNALSCAMIVLVRIYPNRTKVGTLTQAQLRQIAEAKLVDLNARDVDQAMRIIEGTARSMGIAIQG